MNVLTTIGFIAHHLTIHLMILLNLRIRIRIRMIHHYIKNGYKINAKEMIIRVSYSINIINFNRQYASGIPICLSFIYNNYITNIYKELLNEERKERKLRKEKNDRHQLRLSRLKNKKKPGKLRQNIPKKEIHRVQIKVLFIFKYLILFRMKDKLRQLRPSHLQIRQYEFRRIIFGHLSTYSIIPIPPLTSPELERNMKVVKNFLNPRKNPPVLS